MYKIGNRDQGSGNRNQGSGIRDQGSRLESIAGWQNVLITNNDPSPQSLVPKISVHPCLLAVVLCITVILLTRCTSLVQKGGEILDGSAFAEKTLAIYRISGAGEKTAIEVRELGLKSGEKILEISNGAWPGFTLRGSMPEADGSIYLTEARFLSSHTRGWNEFTMDIIGGAIFQNPGPAVGILRITGEVERVEISSGRIRLKSDYITGSAAITPLRNRRERITALVEWMNEQLSLSRETPAFTDIGEFEGYWKKMLFPELVLAKNRPAEYSVNNAEWKREDGVNWNLGYTGTVFPEGLWEYRNSGAMLRDWEEALPWIFMEYSWNTIIGSFNNAILQKIK